MTEKQLRDKVVAIVRSWVGLKESDGSFKKILDIYNSYTPLPRGVKMQTNYAWCAATVSAAFIKAGLADIGFVECSCSQMIKLYKKKGRWMEADSYTPSHGDLIMYDWGDSGKGDNTGAPEHVGMVVAVSGKTIRVIEGNKDNAVGYRTLSVNGKYIRGYCLPDYAARAAAEKVVVRQPELKAEAARSFTKQFARTYTVTAASLHLRKGAGTSHVSFKTLKKGEKVTCYGYYTKNGATIWLLVKDRAGTVGFCSKKYLE